MANDEWRDLEEAYTFRDNLVPRADGHIGAAPWWHGWAIAEAYLAGRRDERKHDAAQQLKALREKVDPEWLEAIAAELVGEQNARLANSLRFIAAGQRHVLGDAPHGTPRDID